MPASSRSKASACSSAIPASRLRLRTRSLAERCSTGLATVRGADGKAGTDVVVGTARRHEGQDIEFPRRHSSGRLDPFQMQAGGGRTEGCRGRPQPGKIPAAPVDMDEIGQFQTAAEDGSRRRDDLRQPGDEQKALLVLEFLQPVLRDEA